MAIVYEITLQEYEEGLGIKRDETLYFPTEASARSFQKDFNAVPDRPDWWMHADDPQARTVPDDVAASLVQRHRTLHKQ